MYIYIYIHAHLTINLIMYIYSIVISYIALWLDLFSSFGCSRRFEARHSD